MTPQEASDDFRAPITHPTMKPPMQKVGFMVEVFVPESANLEALAQEIRNSVEFGSPRVRLAYAHRAADQ